ncbi:MAG: hypothetical protein J0L76_16660 [Rhodobacterales bacterium]|nr:hypothetical protein [Rhodobacterales bacterium]
MGRSYDLTGEAVVVDVLPGLFLFALLKGAGGWGDRGAGGSVSDAGDV